MSISLTQYFEFLQSTDDLKVKRYEVSDAVVAAFRKNARTIISSLNQVEYPQAQQISSALRYIVMELLTTPRPFDQNLIASVKECFGDPDRFGRIYGDDLRQMYDIMIDACAQMCIQGNSLVKEVSEILNNILSSGRTLRIYCHKNSETYFRDILEVGEAHLDLDQIFINSLRQYQQTTIFDDLVKVGPLRSRGWGATPDAILTAPRYRKLIQIVWSGCLDESDFGFDPVFELRNVQSTFGGSSEKTNSNIRRWKNSSIKKQYSERFNGTIIEEIDDILGLSVRQERQEYQPAILLQFDGHGAFYRRHSQVVGFDPNKSGNDAFNLFVIADAFHEGMYLVVTLLGEVDLGGVSAQHGECSKLWKKELRENLRLNRLQLFEELRNDGIGLVHLESRVLHWSKEPETVIPAPQILSHFKILLKNVGIGDEKYIQNAWDEIKKSRGEAIHAGFEEHDFINERILEILVENESLVRKKIADDGMFAIPDQYGLNGLLVFYHIEAMESGFSVPNSELKMIKDDTEIDQWRE